MEIICTSFTFPKCLALPGNDGSCNLCEVLEAHENIGRLCSIVHSDLFISKIYLGISTLSTLHGYWHPATEDGTSC